MQTYSDIKTSYSVPRKKVYMCVCVCGGGWGVGDSVQETWAEESEIVAGKRKMWRERVTEEGEVGRREINQLN